MRIVILIVVAALAACGGGDDGFETQRDAVLAIGAALCARAIECGGYAEADRDACEGEFAGTACGTIACSDPFVADEVAVERCIDALDDWPCSADTLPGECQDVL